MHPEMQTLKKMTNYILCDMIDCTLSMTKSWAGVPASQSVEVVSQGWKPVKANLSVLKQYKA